MHRLLVTQYGTVKAKAEYESPDHPSPEFRRRVECLVDSLAELFCTPGYYDVEIVDLRTGDVVDYDICMR